MDVNLLLVMKTGTIVCLVHQYIPRPSPSLSNVANGPAVGALSGSLVEILMLGPLPSSLKLESAL